jgi:ATP-binding cassette subfamily F protein uup
VAGLEAPDAGSVAAPGGVRIEYLPQEPPLDDSAERAGDDLSQRLAADAPAAQLRTPAAASSTPDDAACRRELLALSAELDRSGGWAAEANAKTVLTQLGVTDFTRVWAR